jgi:protein involved in polysaccharide export with SLBB domain
MNCCLNKLSSRKNPAVAGSRPRHWWGRVLISKAAILSGIFFIVAIDMLKAADVPVTNLLAGSPAISQSTNTSVLNSANAFDVLDDKYRLAIGDQLSFRILEDEADPDSAEAPKTLTVTDSGDVQIPYIGRYPAVGKTCKELALALKTELEKNYYYHATVVIAVDSKPRSRGKIYLVGAIRTAGPQDISSDEDLTLSRAVLRAGGFTDFADGKKVTVTRGTGVGADGKKTFTVNVTQVLEKGKTEKDLPLLPGDLIFVPERMIRF